MLDILAQTHKLVANNIHQVILKKYGIELNISKLEWGSVAPDVLPYYKLIRHYKDESLNYIVREIISLIYLCRYSDLINAEDSLVIRYLSRKIGIISHYLCDYTCYPHAHRMTFLNDMKSHIKYESDLAEYALIHSFKNLNLDIEKLNIYDDSNRSLNTRVSEYINKIIDDYLEAGSCFENDLNYAFELSKEITCFIIETILDYSEEMQYQFI
ncbi:hypothetical protein ING2D1G_0893 [Peptoniphilus sp. ING2-D1G]|nr:hypothetical protein ING2D1G_0893 [Peptoniphilus sp. ING2-D1G]